MNSVMQLFSGLLPFPIDNPIVWLIGFCAAGLIAAGLIYRVITLARVAYSRRLKAASLRGILDSQACEIDAIKQTIVSMRSDIDVHRQRKAEEDKERLRLAELSSQREHDPEHAELEEQLLQASKKSSLRIDA